jgi:hypothetical protein
LPLISRKLRVFLVEKSERPVAAILGPVRHVGRIEMRPCYQRKIEETARIAGVWDAAAVSLTESAGILKRLIAGRAAFGQSIALSQRASRAAVSTLLKITTDPNAPASTRVRPADSILDHAAKAIELENIGVRVAQLEAAAKAASTV